MFFTARRPGRESSQTFGQTGDSRLEPATPVRVLYLMGMDVQGSRTAGDLIPAGVRGLVALNNERKLDATYPIFGMICIELWCRMFIDRPAPEMFVA